MLVSNPSQVHSVLKVVSKRARVKDTIMRVIQRSGKVLSECPKTLSYEADQISYAYYFLWYPGVKEI